MMDYSTTKEAQDDSMARSNKSNTVDIPHRSWFSFAKTAENLKKMKNIFLGEPTPPGPTFDFHLENCYSLDVKVIDSKLHRIFDLLWRIKLVWTRDYDRPSHKNLGVFLQCEGISESFFWSCPTKVKLTLVSQKEGVEDITKNFHHYYTAKRHAQGFPEFVNWRNLLAYDGFIKNNTIIFRVQIDACVENIHAPINTPPTSKLISSEEYDVMSCKWTTLIDDPWQEPAYFEESMWKACWRYFFSENPILNPLYSILEGRMEIVLKNVNLLFQNEEVLSKQFMICDLPWNILVERQCSGRADQPQGIFAAFVECNQNSENVDEEWLAHVQFIILSQKDGVENLTKRHTSTISPEKHMVWANLGEWAELMDPKVGYIKDNTIILRVHIVIDHNSIHSKYMKPIKKSSTEGKRSLNINRQLSEDSDQSHLVSLNEDTTAQNDCYIFEDNNTRPQNYINFNIRKWEGKREVFIGAHKLNNLLWCVAGRHENDVLMITANCCTNFKVKSVDVDFQVRFVILSQEEGVEDILTKGELKPGDDDLGYLGEMKWSEIFNPDNGYMKNDEIILRVFIDTYFLEDTDNNFEVVTLLKNSTSNTESTNFILPIYWCYPEPAAKLELLRHFLLSKYLFFKSVLCSFGSLIQSFSRVTLNDVNIIKNSEQMNRRTERLHL